jgi:hypothetical protein
MWRMIGLLAELERIINEAASTPTALRWVSLYRRFALSALAPRPRIYQHLIYECYVDSENRRHLDRRMPRLPKHGLSALSQGYTFLFWRLREITLPIRPLIYRKVNTALFKKYR